MEEKAWVEIYRPNTIDDCVLPPRIKGRFAEIVKSGYIPNMLLCGRAGVGKTTVAKAMLNELKYDCLVINASLNGNIDTLRTDITQFASSVSLFGGKKKYVILDEADYLNPNSTQPSLRSFMEEFSSNCGFILTCNYPNRIIEPLRSRLAVIDFAFEKGESAALMAEFFKRVSYILKTEGVEFDKAVLAQVVAKYFPDFRKVLNELQSHAASGRIGTNALSARTDVTALMSLLKKRDFNAVRKWVGENSDVDSVAVMRAIYDAADEHVSPKSVVDLVYLIARYQYQAAFVADHELNLTAFLAEFMTGAEFL